MLLGMLLLWPSGVLCMAGSEHQFTHCCRLSQQLNPRPYAQIGLGHADILGAVQCSVWCRPCAVPLQKAPSTVPAKQIVLLHGHSGNPRSCTLSSTPMYLFRPQDEGALAGEGLRSVTLRSPSRSPWGSDLRMASVSETSPFAAAAARPPPLPAVPAQPPPAAVAAVDNYVESLRRTSEVGRSRASNERQTSSHNTQDVVPAPPTDL